MVVSRPKYVGSRVNRVEDTPVLLGKAQYVDDLTLPGTLACAFLRSPHAHALIRRIDTVHARQLDGVFAIYTGREVSQWAKPLQLRWTVPGQRLISQALMAVDRTRWVGEPLALVVATDPYVADDALDLIDVEYEALPPLTSAEAALAPNAPLLYPDWGTNQVATWRTEGGDVEQAFATAAHTIQARFGSQRYTGMPMETRGVLARYEQATGELTFWSSTQVPHRLRTDLALTTGLPEHRIRVIAPYVGGGFGIKDHTYPEEVILAAAAIRANRPIKWIEDRREHFLSANHAREQIHDCEVAFTDDGTIVGLRDHIIADMGAQMTEVGAGPPLVSALVMPGPYRIRHYKADVEYVVTNKVPHGAYRGFGIPQSVFVMERLIDLIAADRGLDPAEVRFRNFIQPDEFPYHSAGGPTYDSGDYPECLRRALAAIDYESVRTEQVEGRRQGRYLGIGISCYVEGGGYGPSAKVHKDGFKIGGYETADIRIEPTGKVTLLTGLSPHGQGAATALAQLCADELGVRIDDIVVITGDTAICPYSPMGTIASRGAVVGGGATIQAASQLRAKLIKLAAEMLEASPDDLAIVDGHVTVRGSPSRGLAVAEIARAAYTGIQLPADMEPGLVAKVTYEPPGFTFANAAHVVVVEIDPETGHVALRRYVVVHDCGTIIHPGIVDGQVRGGIAQGIGGAIYEELSYDESGQLLTTTYLDYAIPSTTEIPDIEVHHLETPSPLVPGGMKGMGEAGTIGAPAAVANAIADALAPFGVAITETPLTPNRIRQLLRTAERAGTAPPTGTGGSAS